MTIPSSSILTEAAQLSADIEELQEQIDHKTALLKTKRQALEKIFGVDSSPAKTKATSRGKKTQRKYKMSPEGRAKIKAAQIARWSNPERRAQGIARIKASCATRKAAKAKETAN